MRNRTFDVVAVFAWSSSPQPASNGAVATTPPTAIDAPTNVLRLTSTTVTTLGRHAVSPPKRISNAYVRWSPASPANLDAPVLRRAVAAAQIAVHQKADHHRRQRGEQEQRRQRAVLLIFTDTAKTKHTSSQRLPGAARPVAMAPRSPEPPLCRSLRRAGLERLPDVVPRRVIGGVELQQPVTG